MHNTKPNGLRTPGALRIDPAADIAPGLVSSDPKQKSGKGSLASRIPTVAPARPARMLSPAHGRAVIAGAVAQSMRERASGRPGLAVTGPVRQYIKDSCGN